MDGVDIRLNTESGHSCPIGFRDENLHDGVNALEDSGGTARVH